MRNIYFILAFLTIPFVSVLSTNKTVEYLDSDWKFSKGKLESITNPSSIEWEEVQVPHTWNDEDGAGQKEDTYYRGYGSYMKYFNIDASSLKKKQIYIRFEAVSSVAEVYVNKNYVGKHIGSFSAFTFDITPFLREGENELIVIANNEWNENIIPLAGDFTVFGGIYRPVSLMYFNPVSITPLDDASTGVYITQKLKDDIAELSVNAKIINNLKKKTRLKVEVLLKDLSGLVLKSNYQKITIQASSLLDLDSNITLENPILWNGRENPYLYTVEVRLYRNNRLIDQNENQIGIRTFHVDPEKGFYLNGKPYKLHGVNRHQDREGKGWAISNDDHLEDFEMIYEMGANAIRLAHYQHSEYFYSLCDKYGLLVWAEIPFIEQASYTSEFLENTKQQLRELIKQNYNRPSIFAWGLFNELTRGEPQDIVQELNDLAKELDKDRYTVCAPNHQGRPENMISDLLAHNTYPGWYWSDPDAMQPSLGWWNSSGGKKGICVSEYGAGASIYHHDQEINSAPKTDAQWHPEEWQSKVHEGNYKHIKNADFVWGSFVWNMFDFGVAARNEGDRPGINDKGLVTYDRKIRKDAFYFYKANWSDEPVIHITSKRHAVRNKAVTDIKLYSNLENIQLFVNGESIPSPQAENCVYVWTNITLKHDLNNIEVQGTRNGKLYKDFAYWLVRE